MDATNALAQLKDIHLPGPVSIFPLAIIWYILIVIFLVFSIFSIWKIIKSTRRKRKLNYILNLLSKIESTVGNSNALVSDVSILLKRVAIMQFKDQNPHILFDEDWLKFLDTTGRTNQFTQGDGRFILKAYSHEVIDIPDMFFVVVRNWIKVVI